MDLSDKMREKARKEHAKYLLSSEKTLTIRDIFEWEEESLSWAHAGVPIALRESGLSFIEKVLALIEEDDATAQELFDQNYIGSKKEKFRTEYLNVAQECDSCYDKLKLIFDKWNPRYSQLNYEWEWIWENADSQFALLLIDMKLVPWSFVDREWENIFKLDLEVAEKIVNMEIDMSDLDEKVLERQTKEAKRCYDVCSTLLKEKKRQKTSETSVPKISSTT